MVARYVPAAGDIIWMDFDPQKGREQTKRRPALVLTEQTYNRASGWLWFVLLRASENPIRLRCPWS